MTQRAPASYEPPSSVATLVSPDIVVTRRGSRLYDLEWDFRDDGEPTVRVMNWDVPIIASGVTIARLGDPAFEGLLRPLQEAIVMRWKYYRREDGQPWQTRRVGHAVRVARTFGAWAGANGITCVSAITEAAFRAWLAHVELRQDGLTPRNMADRQSLGDIVLLLWRMRGRITSTLGFIPESDRIADWIQSGPQSQPIPLVPKPILDHLVGAAVCYLEVYAHDILSARSYVQNLKAQWERENVKPAPNWRDRRAHGTHNSWVGRRFGAQKAGARRVMGQPAPWNEDGRFVIDPDTGEPWLTGIRTRHHLKQLENSLRTAAFVIIAFTTGARRSEIASLKTGCASSTQQVGSVPARHAIAGHVTKHRGRKPQAVSWGVPPIAVKAVETLDEMLAHWRAKVGTDRLFVTLHGATLGGLIGEDLRQFLSRIDAPYVDGKPFNVTPHMLRVALAQWLAQEPYGEVAGAIHLKQLSTAAFRGYLREDPQFKSLFDGFLIQSQADHLEMVMNEPVLRGRQGDEIMRSRTPEQQAEIEAHVRSINYAQAGRDVPSPATIEKLKKGNRPVYKTKFTLCFFKGDAAECLKGRSAAERKRPLTHRCEPLTCANSAITRLQVPAYLEDFHELNLLACDPSQSPSQILICQAQLMELGQLIIAYVPTLIAELELLDRQLEGADPREAATVALRSRRTEVAELLRRIDQGGVAKMAEGRAA